MGFEGRAGGRGGGGEPARVRTNFRISTHATGARGWSSGCRTQFECIGAEGLQKTIRNETRSAFSAEAGSQLLRGLPSILNEKRH